MSIDGRLPQAAEDRDLGSQGAGPALLYDPRLVEEGVFLALGEHPEAQDFQRQRDRLYEMADPEEREHAFHELHRAWFRRLGLADGITAALAEQPLLASAIKTCVIACAPGKRQEEADLLVRHEEDLQDRERRTLRLLISPESLLDPPALRNFLRHELFHIRDMVDPRFSYEPELPVAEAGPAHDRLLRDRYRILWDMTIDGRMLRRAWAPEAVRARRLDEFARAFPMFGAQTLQVFGSFFDHEPHTHGELVAMARDPRAVLGNPRGAQQPGSRCPLCHFPSYAFEPRPESLGATALGWITREFPDWEPSRGLCLQCADLYRARR